MTWIDVKDDLYKQREKAEKEYDGMGNRYDLDINKAYALGYIAAIDYAINAVHHKLRNDYLGY
jgi:hypothetical protein